MPDATDTTATATATTAASTDATKAATTATADNATAVVAPVTDWINPDGTFKDGWKDHLVPEDFRKSNVYDVFPDVKGLMKQLGHQHSLIGKQGKGVMPLGEKPSPTEVEMFRKAMGVPDKPDGYKFDVPQGLDQYYEKPMIAEAKAAMHEANLTPGQFAVVMELDRKRLAAGLKMQEEGEVKQRAEAEAELKRDWGENFDGNLKLAKRVVTESLTKEEQDGVLPIIGNNAKVAKLFAKLGEAYLEDKVVDPDASRPQGSVQTEIDRLEATTGYVTGELRRTNRKEHDRILARLTELYKKRHPETESATV